MKSDICRIFTNKGKWSSIDKKIILIRTRKLKMDRKLGHTRKQKEKWILNESALPIFILIYYVLGYLGTYSVKSSYTEIEDNDLTQNNKRKLKTIY